MLTKLKQIWRDHQAMQTIRKRNGDVYLRSFISGQHGHGFDCYTRQVEETIASNRDPAQAILDS